MTAPKTTLTSESMRATLARLTDANQAFARAFPGEPETRQPVHTVYGGAHLFKADMPAKLGTTALRTLDEYAPDFITFARAVGLPGATSLPESVEEAAALRAQAARDPAGLRQANRAAWIAFEIYSRVREKLAREGVEDFRIDFEDGFGNRPDAEEDATAVAAAREVGAALAAGTLPPFIGIRIKPLNEELRTRSIRTLDLFVTTLVEASGGRLPPNFVVTIPKVTVPEQVVALVDLFKLLEKGLGLADGALKMEMMIEMTQSIIDASGNVNLPRLLHAAGGRCVGAHFGTYDYTAGCNITAAYQTMAHPSCDFARHVMLVSFARTGVFVSDGATNVMPVPIHRVGSDGRPLSLQQQVENRAAVHAAWRLHYSHVRDSLMRGLYQGWDLHPGQLATRYAAVYAFFLEGLAAAAERLKNFVEKAAQATLVGDVFDDAATGQGLLNYFLRAINCGAVSEDDALRMTGLTLDEVRGRSFVKILAKRGRS